MAKKEQRRFQHPRRVVVSENQRGPFKERERGTLLYRFLSLSLLLFDAFKLSEKARARFGD